MFEMLSIGHAMYVATVTHRLSKPMKGLWHRRLAVYLVFHIVTVLINALPGNSYVNTAQHATIEEAVFSVDPTDAPIDWLHSHHVICVYCMSMSVPRLYK
jgi:hypothetical protein